MHEFTNNEVNLVIKVFKKFGLIYLIDNSSMFSVIFRCDAGYVKELEQVIYLDLLLSRNF